MQQSVASRGAHHRRKAERRYPLTKQLIQTWYMKHVFKDLRGSWRCAKFARTKTKKSYKSQAEMARSVNLQRASARAAAASRNQTAGGSDSTNHRWMFKTFSSLYSDSQRRFRTKDKFSKLKNRLLRSSDFDGRDPVSSSSLAELIPRAEFDLDNLTISSTDSDPQTTGAPPSRRSSDSLLCCNCESSTGPVTAAQRSPIRAIRQHRRKRSVFRAAKLALSRNGNAWETSQSPVLTGSSGIGRSKYTHGIATMTEKPGTTHQAQPTPENLSRGTSMTMDTSSSPCKSPTKSNSPTSWHENNYDMLTETLSASSWSTSLRTDASLRLHEAKRGSGRRQSRGGFGGHVDAYEDWREVYERAKPAGGSRLAPPTSSEDLQRRQASIINGALHTLPGKDFQEAIVDIILENDVHDLVDLEEFLQGYFRLNTLYQDIVQQFFNDLSSDIVHAQVSRAPSVIARLASANRKPVAIPKTARRSVDFSF